METEIKTITEAKNQKKNVGGRPKKSVKRDRFIAVKCTAVERKLIEAKAKSFFLSVSEYIREMALRGTILPKIKTLPKEVLGFTATLNHLAANLNQIAKKRNGFEELSVSERSELKVQSEEVKNLTTEIKNYLQENN
ncbi:mobilization protein [Arachidicoccus ginsenosidimutans]|uniref:plasmid mobilization protein n=1 Tax=Arachidicoccus sp. BS20 TaxID=1850526 RepID=UPI0007F0773F|nr:mobilization protein [Arachidicoccus sp. BS20]ANI89394.1 mobilization protein [Arachidicoccus sp. BS20]